MNYKRVIPRDLFNEADLLKMLGILVLYIHNGSQKWSYQQDCDDSFEIHQDQSDGSIFCSNIKFYLDKQLIHIYRPLNTREKFSLYGRLGDQEIAILDSQGRVMPERPWRYFND